MNLAQMFALANSKSGYSRDEAEIWNALDQGGYLAYLAVRKESDGLFIKFDTTSLTLIPGTEEYTMPLDMENLITIGERISTTIDWQKMQPLDLDDEMDNQQNVNYALDFSNWGYSRFGFFGPYLTSTLTTGGTSATVSLPGGIVGVKLTPKGTQQIRVSPQIDTPRLCQIVYTAKWLPITDPSSLVMLPDEGTYAMLDYAVAELKRSNDDSLSVEYETSAERRLNAYLVEVRKQLKRSMIVKPYGPGWQ